MLVKKGCSDESDYPGCQTTKRENGSLRDRLEPGVDAVFGLGVEVLSQIGTAAERERERIESSLISVSEVLSYLQTDRFMDLKEVTEYLPLSERTVREHLKTIPHFRCGRKIIFKKSELDLWMEGFRVRDQDLDQAMKMAKEMLG